METRQTLGLIGSVILFLGVFAPIISVPIIGNINYFQNGKGDGVIIFALSGVSLVLTLTKKYKGLWFTGIASLGILGYTFINFHMKMGEMKEKMNVELAGNPFRGFADIAVQSVQFQWGWALLIVGATIILIAAAIKSPAIQNSNA